MADATHVFHWHRLGRKDEPCRVLATSRRGPPFAAPAFIIDQPPPRDMGSVLVEFGDGFRMVTSRRAIRRLEPTP